MAAVLNPLPFQHPSSGILINPSHMSILPMPNVPISNKFSNTPSNNSLASSCSSSGNNTDVSSNSHQSLSKSSSAPGPSQPQNSSPLSKVATRSYSSPNTRRSRIRFAPLPVPRALEPGEAGENDVELELDGADATSNFDDSDAGCSSLSSSLVSSLPLSTSKESSCTSIGETSTSPPSSIKAPTTRTISPDSPDTDQRTHTSGASTPTIKKASSGWGSIPNKLFKPFLRRSSLPMPPASSSGITAEDIFTLGTINLFRSSSRESRRGSISTSSDDNSRARSRSGSWGSPLSRWTSSGTFSGQKNKQKEWQGSPLARTESTQSSKSDVRARPSQARPSTAPSTSAKASTSTPPPQNRKSRLKGTKMLNGRVYGGRRINAQNTNLFATAKDEEPEFVEWGYGGMGSVKSRANGGSQWSRLQSGEAMGLKSTGGGGGNDDDDDGGGMSWVKKRKEQRERQRLEAEAKAKLEAAGGGEPTKPETTDNSGDVVAAHTEAVLSPKLESAAKRETDLPAGGQAAYDTSLAPLAPVLISTDEAPLSPTSVTTTSNPEEHRITTAVTVPAPPHHRVPHHRSNSATFSQTSGIHLPVEGERDRNLSPLRSSSLDAERGRKEEVATDLRQDDEDDNASRSDSGSNSESESEGSDSEDEDEDDAEAEQIRKTALGAGVEKISRLNKDER